MREHGREAGPRALLKPTKSQVKAFTTMPDLKQISRPLVRNAFSTYSAFVECFCTENYSCRSIVQSMSLVSPRRKRDASILEYGALGRGELIGLLLAEGKGVMYKNDIK